MCQTFLDSLGDIYLRCLHILSVLTSCLDVSNESRPMKQVIWRKKSIMRAIPAYKAKALTAGIVDNEPVI